MSHKTECLLRGVGAMLAAVGLLACSKKVSKTSKTTKDHGSFERAIFTTHASTKEPTLDLIGVTGDQSGFYGDLVLFQAIPQGSASPPPIIIQGHHTPDFTFCPNMEFAVSNDLNGRWVVIESSFSDSKYAEIKFFAVAEGIRFEIKLDAFEPMIGKYKFGRIKLQSGVSTTFSLMSLSKSGA